MKKALITGVAGQDGPYLAKLLLGKGYEVHGLIRGTASDKSNPRLHKVSHVLDSIKLHRGDVADYPTMCKLIAKAQPDEVYHLAAIAGIGPSFEDEFGTLKCNTNGTHYLLSAVKELKPDAKFFFASTSEIFGNAKTSPQNEETPINSTSPYGISKAAGLNLAKMYREVHKIFACTGIIFNHISPYVDVEFLPRKITLAAAKIKMGMQKELRLGNLNVKRDWGFAGDYVEAMQLILNQDKPGDYVIGTGETHAVREVLDAVFGFVGLDWKKYVVVDEKFVRPAEAFEWRADITKIKQVTGWVPQTDFKSLLKMMVDADLENLQNNNV
ncbi:MAG: GDP-mannose 4,6-dehydratase [Candidatus Liptonbacteria bacterium]|nr:GDP-mannose 4,6-dehydratase [Candidatus Liptonbacteria bacterium]